MKKKLTCLAIGCAAASLAPAANVSIYGVMDTGLAYNHTSVTGQDSTRSLQMKSGQTMGSR